MKIADWIPEIDDDESGWQIPDRFNIAADSLDAHSEDAPAIIQLAPGGSYTVTFGELRLRAQKLANWMLDSGLQRGDRVAVFLPQCWELPVIHYACYYAGLIAVPLTTKFGGDAVSARGKDAGVQMLFGRNEDLKRISHGLTDVPSLERVIAVDVALEPGDHTLTDILVSETTDHVLGDTRAEEPALLIYTSGTTGPPKGALHSHRVLIGHLPCIRRVFDNFPQESDVVWTPAEWAWIGGLVNTLLTSMACGVPVIANDQQISPEISASIIDEQGVTCAVIPPTLFKQMRAHRIYPHARSIRAIGTGGESVGADMHAWIESTFGVPANEVYGQTENNLVVCQWRQRYSYPADAMGRATPGFDLAILRDDGTVVVDGSVGEIAVKQPNGSAFLKYWNNPTATAAKLSGPWLRTGDRGRMSPDGDVWYEGRTDDVISSSGYRIGPGEIEATLLEHPAVALVAVVGEPDELRGEAIAAHIVLAPGTDASDELADRLKSFVKNRLAFYQYPRRIYFHDELPMTTTGKLLRRALRDGVA